MTLFLIAIIVFFAIWGYQVLDRKAKKAEERKKNTANLPLQQTITQKWTKIVDDRLDVIDPDTTPCQFLRCLYDEYGVPYASYLGIESAKEDYLLALSEESSNEISTARETFGGWISEDAKSAAVAQFRNKYTLKERIWGTSSMKMLPHCGYLEEDAPGHFIKRLNHSGKVMYDNLIYELIRKELYENGYKMYTGNGTTTQEQDVKAKAIEDYQKKYPWLYK